MGPESTPSVSGSGLPVESVLSRLAPRPWSTRESVAHEVAVEVLIESLAWASRDLAAAEAGSDGSAASTARIEELRQRQQEFARQAATLIPGDRTTAQVLHSHGDELRRRRRDSSA